MPTTTTNQGRRRLAAFSLLIMVPLTAVSRLSEECPASAENALFDAGGLWTTLSAEGLLGMEATHEGLGPGLLIEDWEMLFMATPWVGAKLADGTARVTSGRDGWWLGQEELRVLEDDAPVRERDTRWISAAGTSLSDRFEGCAWSREEHQPLGLDVETVVIGRRDLSSPYLLLIFRLQNTSEITLRDVYCGLYWDGDVGPVPENFTEAARNAADDITGFRRFADGRTGFLELAFLADGEHPNPRVGDGVLVPMGVGVAHLPVDDNPYIAWGANYNWWRSDANSLLDWGPGTPFPDGSDGTPDGDANKYRLLSDWADEGPDPDLLEIVDPCDVRFLLSFRVPDLPPTKQRLAVFAIAAAEVWQGQLFVTERLEETILQARDFLERLPIVGGMPAPAMIGHGSHITLPVMGE